MTILLGAQTSYRCEDYKGQAVFDVERAEEKTYAQLKADHIADYKSYYDRANISLCDNSAGNSALPTDERLALVKEGKPDNKLIEMYHNFGRYLLIAGSRETVSYTHLRAQDREFLSEKYDTLKEAAEFFLDFLIEDKKGRLVTCPSVSPENTYLTASGSKGSICIGPSMDSQIIYELFTAVAEASKILETDGGFRKKVLEARDRLPAPEIGKYGQIMEWAEDYDEVEPGHRHISQLFALYPADIITMRKTPELAKAARATLERRLSHGGGHTGWSRAWIINHWARLFDGEKVYENVIALLSNSTSENMFDMHPPFQIDGNFGGTAGITEALLQSENGEIILLPALPKEWSEGSFKGLCARGGFVIDLEWKDSKITACHIHSRCGKKCRIVCDSVKVHTASSEVQTLYTDGAAEFDTETGKTYTLTF